MESKKAIYDLLPQGLYPSTLFFDKETNGEEIIAAVRERQLKFPMIGKPDIGMQGKGVKKLPDIPALLAYGAESKVAFLVQEFVPYEHEVGIFYYRDPRQRKGCISGIVQKEFLCVTGDGVSTMDELLQNEKRHILQLPVLRKTYGDDLKKILNRGEKFLLVPYGNHARGAKFTDASHLIDDTLIDMIDGVCQQVPGFYFGRLDIRYQSWEELKQGKNFTVIELNGAGSEPTHMYDPRHSIFFAWKEILRHLNILSVISSINRRLLNLPYMKWAAGLAMLKSNRRHVKLLKDDHRRANDYFEKQGQEKLKPFPG